MTNSYYNSGFMFDNAALNEVADERVLEHYDDIHNSDIRGKERFNCKVMSKGPEADQQASGRYYMCYVRPMNTMHDHCTPDPCEDSDFSPKELKVLTSMQMLVSTEYPIGTHNRAPHFLEGGEISFYGEGPNASSCKMRVARFQATAKQNSYGYECAGKQIPGPRGAFGSPKTKPLGRPRPQTNVVPQPASKIISSIKDSDYVFLFGDSQMGDHHRGNKATGGKETYGYKLKNQFKKSDKVGIGSKTPKYFVDNYSKIKKYIDKKPKLIIISLGGNGSSGAKDLVEKIKTDSPSSKIIWIGAPPMAKDGFSYSKNWEGKTKTRKKRNSNIKAAISGMVDTFINPYDIMGEVYTCSKNCDGVHMVGTMAQEFINKAGLKR